MFSSLFKKVLRFRLSPLPARQSWSFQSASLNRIRGGEKSFVGTKYGAKELKNSTIMDLCIGKNVKLEKRCKMTPWTQKSALIQPRTILGKGLKSGYSAVKDPVGEAACGGGNATAS